jgi:iron(III) transport system ATP-binding protein
MPDPGWPLQVSDLAVTYDGTPVLRDVDLDVAPGEVVALLGPSGSGKSTLLHAVAGFLPVVNGEIRIRGTMAAAPRRSLPPERRDVAMVFQNYALWPHLTVTDTVAYPLRRAGTDRARSRASAQDLLDRLRIGHLGARRPAELSGGEQQRVGLGRALARNASVYLFDEPTAHLDTHVRAVFLEEVVTRLRATGAAALYATHDAAEALAVADRVALLGGGGIVQIGTPEQVYGEPVSLWAARLTGPASMVTARVDDGGHVRFDLDGTDEGPVRLVLLRPDWVELDGPLSGRVAAVRYRGPYTDVIVDSPAGEVLAREPGTSRRRPGEPVSWAATRVWVLPDNEM